MILEQSTSLVERRNAVLIVAARFVSDLGAFLNMVTLSTFTYLTSGSALLVGVVLAGRVGAGLVASIAAPAVLKVWHGKAPLVALDLVRAATMSTLLWIPGHQLPLCLPLIGALLGASSSLFSIGLNSQLPLFVGGDRRARVNGLITSFSSFGAVFGSLAAGIVTATLGFRVAFMITTATYLAAGLLITPLRAILERGPSEIRKQRLLEEWRLLRPALRIDPIVTGIFVVGLFDTLGSAAHNVGFPIFAQILRPNAAARMMGFMLSSWACGKLFGASLAGRVGGGVSEGTKRRLEHLYFLGVLLMSSGFILGFRQDTIASVLVFLLVAGVGDGLSEVSMVSRFQCSPEQVRLPIFSLLMLVQLTGFSIGMLLSAPFFSWWTPAQVVLLFHGFPLLALLVVAIRTRATPWMSRKRNSLLEHAE